MSSVNLLDELSNDMRVHGAILVIGAGGSYESGMPLYAQFPTIIWRVIDRFNILKSGMGYDANVDAKDIIGTDPVKIIDSFNFIAKNEDALFYFKQQFKNINDHHNKKSSKVHEGICKLIHSGYIKLVISLNWDDLLETSWERLFGTSINSNRVQLLKPHGDVRNITGRWLLPNEDGDISEEELTIINSIKKDYFLDIAILGYSESDKVFVEKALTPNYKDSKVFRISPFSSESIALPASEAIDFLVNKLPVESNNIWVNVDFNNKKGIENALLGYRLRPTDVDACARFPQITVASKRIDNLGYVVIKSEPGCGKSIMSYQIANDYRKLGWEVKKLINENVDYELNFPSSSYKTIYIIDDAHQISDILLDRLIDQVTEDKKMIITKTLSNDLDVDLENIIISKEEAIEALHGHYKLNEKDIVPILNNIRDDIKIGNLHLETPFLELLNEAMKEETPWLFNFYLRGGWNSIRDSFYLIKRQSRSDITLTLIAVHQLLYIDKEIHLEWIIKKGEKWDQTQQHTVFNLEFLEKQKMIIKEIGYRTLHLQMACRIVVKFYSESSESEKKALIDLIKETIFDERTSFAGINLFLNLTNAYTVSYDFHKKVLTEDIISFLIQKWFKEETSENIRDGSFVIDKLLNKNTKYGFCYVVENYQYEFKTIIENTNQTTAYSNSVLLNNMYNEDKLLKKKFVQSLNVDNIILNLSNIDANGFNLYAWANFLDRLRINQSLNWTKKFNDLLPKNEISFALNNIEIGNVFSITKMLSALYQYDKEYAISEYYISLNYFGRNFKHNFVETIQEIDDYLFRYIFWGDELFKEPKRNRYQKERLKAFSDILDEDCLRDGITNGIGRDWRYIYDLLSSVISVDPNKIQNVVMQLDLNEIDKSTSGLWLTQPDDFLMLINILNAYRDDTYLIIENHLDEFAFLKPQLAIAAIPILDKLIEKSKKIVLLDDDNRFGSTSAFFIKKYSKINNGNCKKIIIQNEKIIKNNFILMHPINWDETSIFLIEVAKIYPEFINTLSFSLDLEGLKNTLISYFNNPQYSHHRDKKSILTFKRFLSEVVLISENNELVYFLNYIISEIDKIKWPRGRNDTVNLNLLY